MTRLIVESPYAGDVERNLDFCCAVCRFAVQNGYAPLASHLLYTQFLDDDVPAERLLGIQAGLSWTPFAEKVWFCLRPGDEGLSRGMTHALEQYRDEGQHVEFRLFTQTGYLLGTYHTLDEFMDDLKLWSKEAV